MAEHELPKTRLTITRRAEKDEKELANEVLETEVPMTQEQQDVYQGIIGDGRAKVTVSREVSHMNYGTGYKVFVAVSLTCDQSGPQLGYAATLASILANHFAETHLNEFKPIALRLLTFGQQP